MKQTKYDVDGLNNLFIAVMEQAHEDANLSMPTVRYKPQNKAYNKKQDKRLKDRVKLIFEANMYINNMKQMFSN